ncbi:MAG: hypothetical protein WBM61_02380 [Woeseiaceae bacterium]
MRWLVALLLLASGVCHGSPLFEDDGILEVTLEGPVSKAINDTVKRREYPFSLTVDEAVLNVGVQVRGISRAQLCQFPPLRLDFSSSDTSETIFSGQRRLKLVTHCKKPTDYEENALEEYVAYRIFNVLSDVSFRVRLLRVRYIDTDKPGRDALLRFAFVIEAKKELAERQKGALIETRRVTKNFLDETQVGLAYVFQYLIGNTDWALVRALDSDICCHNGVLVGIDDRHFYVPYDFDRAGLVNARYAKPDPSLRIRRVTQRRYRGYCMSSDALQDALRTVVSRQDEILEIINALADVTGQNLARSADYVQSFFEVASDEERLLREFESHCL